MRFSILYIVMTVTGKDKIEIIEIDPEGEEGRTFGSLVYEEEMYSIGIPTVLYKELLLIAEGKEENLLEKLLEKISSKETYLLDIVPDEAWQHILHVK